MDTVARRLPDLRSAIIDYLKEGNAHVEELYRIDKAHTFDATTTAPENKAFVVDRLASGAKMLTQPVVHGLGHQRGAVSARA